VICLAVQVSSQLPPKPIGEWHYDRAEMYPNPWINPSACKTPAPSGLCDVNGMLTDEERNSMVEQPEMKASNKDCDAKMRISVTVAVMKKIGPQITDYRAAAKEFAEKFRLAWNLGNCSVILIASVNDNMCFLDEGSDVNDLLSAVVREDFDQKINNNCSIGDFVGGINTMLNEYRDALAVAAAQTPAPTPAPTPTLESEAPGGSSTIIIIVIIVVLVVVIGISVIIIIIFIRSKRSRGISTGKPLPSPHEGNPTEKENLKSTPVDV